MSDSYRKGHQSQTLNKDLERAVKHHTSGELHQAAEIYTRILHTDPNYWRALHLLGVVADQSGDPDKAIDLMKKALRINPNDPSCHCDLGLAFHNSGKPEEAITCYQKAIQIMPTFAVAHQNMGYSFEHQGKLDEAISCYQKAIQLRPNFAEAYNNMGNALRSQGRLDEAISCYQKAIQIIPAYAKAHNNLGSAFRSQRRIDEAISCYQKAIQIMPTFAEAHQNIGNLYLDEGKVEESVSSYEKALQIRHDPGTEVKKWFVLPIIHKSRESIEKCRKKLVEQIEKGLEENLRLHDPNDQVGRPPFYLAYHGLNDKNLQQKIASFYIHACPDLAWVSPRLHGKRPPSDKIKIGIVSSKLQINNTIGKLNYGIIKELSRETFHVTLFTCSDEEDEFSKPINRAADEVVVLPSNLKLARQQISEHWSDILFYLDIGMDPLTYYLAFSRLAPVQCMTWGHPSTTGIPNMDYFISCALSEPPGANEHYSERLVCLNRLNTYYYRPELPEVFHPRETFGLPEDQTLYVCPQSLFKIHPDFDELLGSILKEDPRALIVLIQGKYKHWAQLLRDRFMGVFPESLDRVRFLPIIPLDQFLSLLRVADVLLDTTCFGGGNTTLEAFACGVPVVTLPSEFLRGRLTLALYKQMGVMDCVAEDSQSYVKIALRLANDRNWRDEIRSKINENANVLFEDIEAVHELERFFESAVQRERNGDIAS